MSFIPLNIQVTCLQSESHLKSSLVISLPRLFPRPPFLVGHQNAIFKPVPNLELSRRLRSPLRFACSAHQPGRKTCSNCSKTSPLFNAFLSNYYWRLHVADNDLLSIGGSNNNNLSCKPNEPYRKQTLLLLASVKAALERAKGEPLWRLFSSRPLCVHGFFMG